MNGTAALRIWFPKANFPFPAPLKSFDNYRGLNVWREAASDEIHLQNREFWYVPETADLGWRVKWQQLRVAV
ncbi:MAG: hypothetical protein E5X58_35170 [Mesorhizobium sp.]|nr:MAG: hypothetical protein E5X58_35170 [Mesorhizobium sp.]